MSAPRKFFRRVLIALGLGLAAAMILLVHELRSVPAPAPDAERLTDVAAGVHAAAAPWTSVPDPAKLAPPIERPLAPLPKIAPKLMPDPTHPPSFTPSMVAPIATPRPPNPAVPPPMHMNLDRAKPPF